MAQTLDPQTERLLLQMQLQEIDAAIQELRGEELSSTDPDMINQMTGLGLLRSEILQRTITAARNPEAVLTTISAGEYECTACSEGFNAPQTINLSCGHRYCHDCAIEVVRSSLQNVNSFPPRCCNLPLPLATKWKFMDFKLWSQYETRRLEIGDPSPTYCWEPKCSTLISSVDKADQSGTCPRCLQKTCIKCKEKMHHGACMGGIYGHADVTALMAEKGWKRCPRCGHGVERRSGCPHMTYAILQV